ncbi:hypothetical protein ACSETL_36030, partial [Pseudomonas aeruginosa]
GISGRIRVEWVAGSPWNRWSDAYGMGGQMTVESALLQKRRALARDMLHGASEIKAAEFGEVLRAQG